MPDFQSLEPAADPNNKITFLLDWEVTMKCNLDCSYCGRGLYFGHDNSTKHPPLDQCLDTIDFMYEYADLYMSHKPRGLRYVILNVYGGESLHHPDIVEILQNCRDRYARYRDRWNLTITTTTNAVINQKRFNAVIPNIDEFMVSYHCEASDKQKNLFRENIGSIKRSNKKVKCIVLMHPEPDRFQDAQNMIRWCQDNGIPHLAKQLDHPADYQQFNYGSEQANWFKSQYEQKTFGKTSVIKFSPAGDKFDLAASGRACCGGRQLCQDKNYKQRNFYVDNKFTDWHCSVNEFFLYIKQINGEIFVNKDCKMDFAGRVAPIGNLKDSQQLLDWTRNNLESGTMPVIQCKKSSCWCGLCAPKAKTLDDFHDIMQKYRL